MRIAKLFWMVLGEGTPVYRHDTEESANQEAMRLCRQHRGKRFTVLKSCTSFVVSDVETIPHGEEHTEDIPF